MLQQGTSRGQTITCLHTIKPVEPHAGYPRSKFISVDGVQVRTWRPDPESQYAGSYGVECFCDGCYFSRLEADKHEAQRQILEHIYTEHGRL